MFKKIILPVIFTLSASLAYSQIHQPMEPVNVNDLMESTRLDYNHKAKPLEIDIEIVNQESLGNSAKEIKYLDYDLTDAALDASVVGVLWASKSLDPERPDLIKHRVAGAIVTYGSTEVAKIYFKGKDKAKLKSILTGVAANALVAVGKEAVDKLGYGTPDKTDVIHTMIGGALVSVRYAVKF